MQRSIFTCPSWVVSVVKEVIDSQISLPSQEPHLPTYLTTSESPSRKHLPLWVSNIDCSIYSHPRAPNSFPVVGKSEIPLEGSSNIRQVHAALDSSIRREAYFIHERIRKSSSAGSGLTITWSKYKSESRTKLFVICPTHGGMILKVKVAKLRGNDHINRLRPGDIGTHNRISEIFFGGFSLILFASVSPFFPLYFIPVPWKSQVTYIQPQQLQSQILHPLSLGSSVTTHTDT